MNLPFRAPLFDLALIHAWTLQNRPMTVEMTDSQYSWYASLSRKCPQDVAGVPIRFIDAPPSVV